MQADVQRSGTGDDRAWMHLLRGVQEDLTANYEAAIEDYEQTIALTLQEEDPGTGRHTAALSNLGSLYLETDRLEPAERYLRRAYEVRRAGLGESHPLTAKTLSTLAAAARARGDLSRCIEQARPALEVTQSATGPHSTVTMDARLVLADCLQEQGNLDEAMELYEANLEGQRKSDIEGMSRAQLLNNMANTLWAHGRLQEALKLQQNAHTIMEEGLVGGDRGRAVILGNQGRLLSQLGRHDEAIERFEETLELWEGLVDPENPRLLWTLVGLVDAYLGQGRLADADRVSTRAMRIAASPDVDRTDLASVKRARATVLARRQRPEQARALALEGLEAIRGVRAAAAERQRERLTELVEQLAGGR
jgi:tetratricopeptide (TPR) repeat protein